MASMTLTPNLPIFTPNLPFEANWPLQPSPGAPPGGPGSANKSQDVGETPPAGPGSVAGTPHAPEVVAGTAPFVMAAVLASVVEMMPRLSGEDIDVLVLAVTAKMKDTIDASQKDQIKTQQDAKRVVIALKHQKAAEALKKVEDAVYAAHHGSVLDKVKQAFAYIGAALTVAMGIVLMLVPGMQIAGALLIGAGLLMFAIAADQTEESTRGDKLGFSGMMVKTFAKMAGKNDQEAQEAAMKGQMGIRIGLMCCAFLMSVPAMVQGAGMAIAGMAFGVGEAAAGAVAVEVVEMTSEIALEAAEVAEEAAEVAEMAAEMAEMASEMGESLAELLETSGDMAASGGESADAVAEAAEAGETSATTAQTGTSAAETGADGVEVGGDAADEGEEAANTGMNMTRIAEKAQKWFEEGTSAASDVNDAGNAGVDIAADVYKYKASVDQADAKKLQASVKRMEALVAFLDDQIDTAIKHLKDNGDRFAGMLDTLTDAVKDQSDTLFHANFRA